MKIICNKDEYVSLVEICHDNRSGHNYGSCSNCVFSGLCAQGNEPEDGESLKKISDVLEMEEEKC